MGMEVKSEAEEPKIDDLNTLLTAIKNVDGIKKIQDAITAVISGTPDVNVSDRAARLLGVVYGDDAGTPRKIAVDSSGKLRVVTT